MNKKTKWLAIEVKDCEECPYLFDDGRDDPWCTETNILVPYDEEAQEFDYTVPKECPLPDA